MAMARQIYRLLRIRNDIRAVQRGTIGRRLARRAYYRQSGRLAGRRFR